MQILVVTDAWLPQVNGVVHTLTTVGKHLERLGHDLQLISPNLFKTLPCPTYPAIRLAYASQRQIAQHIRATSLCAIHIATEGPLGLAVRSYCCRERIPFTTSFLSRFPEYVHARMRLPIAWTYAALRWFHRPAAGTMVASQSMETILLERGFINLRRWSRGVDTSLFRPRSKAFLSDPRPILLSVGRVAVEKNIEAFLSLKLPGTKIVVGDGPHRPKLMKKYPEVRFVGAKFGEELASYYSAADVLVFPSRTDVFGNVQLEALASGIPVAAYPATGAIDILKDSDAGVLDEDLSRAIERALIIPPENCRAHAMKFSWEESARQFLGNLHPID